MSAAALPKPGDQIAIKWPGGPHDFLMVFDHLDKTMPPGEPGWCWLRGRIVEPPGWCVGQTLYARPIEGGFEMKPHKG